MEDDTHEEFVAQLVGQSSQSAEVLGSDRGGGLHLNSDDLALPVLEYGVDLHLVVVTIVVEAESMDPGEILVGILA